MKHRLIALLGALPLPVNHAIGWAIGWLAYVFSAGHRRRLRANIACYEQVRGTAPGLLRRAIGEQGKGLLELAVVWTAPLPRIYALVVHCEGWQHVDEAKRAGKPVLFITPHLGCYDIAGRYVESRMPLVALYRPPKLAWLEPIMQAGRMRGAGTTVAADAGGVRQLLKTLKAGGNAIILPDQVPAPEAGGDGVWASFFGRPAFTMTLVPRLARRTGAAVLWMFAERLPRGRGYALRIAPPATAFADDKQAAAEAMNRAIESLIDCAPPQYLWAYNRYKHPAGAPPPPAVMPATAA
jgi:KDO2-lipid IV(A) lauroyltransferase